MLSQVYGVLYMNTIPFLQLNLNITANDGKYKKSKLNNRIFDFSVEYLFKLTQGQITEIKEIWIKK